MELSLSLAAVHDTHPHSHTLVSHILYHTIIHCRVSVRPGLPESLSASKEATRGSTKMSVTGRESPDSSDSKQTAQHALHMTNEHVFCEGKVWHGGSFGFWCLYSSAEGALSDDSCNRLWFWCQFWHWVFPHCQAFAAKVPHSAISVYQAVKQNEAVVFSASIPFQHSPYLLVLVSMFVLRLFYHALEYLAGKRGRVWCLELAGSEQVRQVYWASVWAEGAWCRFDAFAR